MIDPMLSLAFAMYSIKGAYALLLGSGVSRSAGIPTGWEVVLDLIQKLAHLMGQDCGPDPAAWYRTTFDAEPGYSTLLDELAALPSERSRLLQGYFEPSTEDREEGSKLPTMAHKAIADMVAAGFIRVIVTTNFDRLLERALEAIGITPTVITTADAVEGALPLVHSRCTVIKLHGDYMDTRIKNSPAELAEYDPRMNGLLDRILDEYGLVICGWSGDWDTALIAAIERCSSRRFTTFWTARGELGDRAKRLSALRLAQVIKISGADSFFRDLAEKTIALEKLNQPHPLSAKVAVASLKKYLADDRYRIELHDLVMREAEQLYARLADGFFDRNDAATGSEDIQDRYRSRVQRYESSSEILQQLIGAGCFWGQSQHVLLWARCIERVAHLPMNTSHHEDWISLQRYPALILLYSAGIASVASGNYATLATLLVKTKVREGGAEQAMIRVVNGITVIGRQNGQMLSDIKNAFAPVSDHLFDRLRAPLRDLLPADEEYEECFDRFEYLLGLAYVDLAPPDERAEGVGPIGCFGWRYRRQFGDEDLGLPGRIKREALAAGSSWEPLKAGMFEGSIDRFIETKTAFDKFVQRHATRLGML